jgi:broad specificity phosphatase PhoE
VSTSAPPTRLLLIRHAHHDPRGRFLQHACTGITEAGAEQARALAARLAADATLVSAAVLASRARRALDTAAILARALATSVAEETCDLCEMHPGAAEGLTQEEMAQRFGPSYQSVPGAESFLDWLPWAGAALEGIAHRYPGRVILTATHAGVIRASLVRLGGMAIEHASHLIPDNTGITEWSFVGEPAEDRVTRWRLERYNDAAHLGG